METIDELLAGLEPSPAADLSARPGRKLAVVTCMDARIDPSALLGVAPGDVHVIRNAGGLVTTDVIRSLSLSQHALGTRDIMLVQHTGCGLRSTEPALRDLIEEGSGTAPDFEIGAFDEVEASVRAGCRSLRASPVLSRRGSIRGFVLEIETGVLREIDG